MDRYKLFEKDPKVHVSIRIPTAIKQGLEDITKETKLDISKLINLAILEWFLLYEKDITYHGIDLKDYAKLCKLELLRNITKKERNEFMSSALFMQRVKTDIFKILLFSPTKLKTNREKLMKKVLDYIEIRKKEANFHDNKKELLGQLDDYRKEAETNIENMKNTIDMKSEIDLKVLK